MEPGSFDSDRHPHLFDHSLAQPHGYIEPEYAPFAYTRPHADGHGNLARRYANSHTRANPNSIVPYSSSTPNTNPAALHRHPYPNEHISTNGHGNTNRYFHGYPHANPHRNSYPYADLYRNPYLYADHSSYRHGYRYDTPNGYTHAYADGYDRDANRDANRDYSGYNRASISY